jgi:hypothetical protein
VTLSSEHELSLQPTINLHEKSYEAAQHGRGHGYDVLTAAYRTPTAIVQLRRLIDPDMLVEREADAIVP